MPKYVFCFFLFAYSCVINAQAQADSLQTSPLDSANKPVYNILPIVFYLPETKLGFGAGGIVSFRFKGEKPSTASSQLQIGATYTLNNQLLLYFPYRLFWKNESRLAYGELGYYIYVYPYYGIGINSTSTDEEFYEVSYPRFRASYLRKVKQNVYLGVRYWLDDFNITRFADNGNLKNKNVIGTAGGRVAGLGVVTNFDSRNNQFYPTQGWFIEGVVLPHTKYVGSEYELLKLSFDAATYLTKGKHTFALNTYLESNIGTVPFYNMAFIGGSKRLRGYIDGRFRDNNAAVLQGEYRWKFYKRFGLTAFYSSGNVFNNLTDLTIAETKQTVGGGLRFQLSKRELVNIRIDYGYAFDGSNNFYLTFGEAF